MDHDWITTLLATGHATTDASPLLGTPTITHVGRSYKAVNGFWYQVTWDAGIPVVNPMGYSSAYLDATRASPPRPRPGHAGSHEYYASLASRLGLPWPHPHDDAPRWVDTNGPAQDVPGPAVHIDPEPWRLSRQAAAARGALLPAGADARRTRHWRAHAPAGRMESGVCRSTTDTKGRR